MFLYENELDRSEHFQKVCVGCIDPGEAGHFAKVFTQDPFGLCVTLARVLHQCLDNRTDLFRDSLESVLKILLMQVRYVLMLLDMCLKADGFSVASFSLLTHKVFQRPIAQLFNHW